MANKGYENIESEGLGWISGKCGKFISRRQELKNTPYGME